MPITTQCPNPTCRKLVRIPDERRGTAVACPSCRTRLDSTPRNEEQTRPEPDPPTRSSDTSLPVVSVDRYQIRATLGSGGFGTVYRAFDPRLEREVALKVLRLEALTTNMAVERFQREAKAVARLNHPNIVPVYDAGQIGDRPYIVYALVQGQSLSEAIREGGLDPMRAARLVARIAEAMAYAHEQGVLHRDIKPANIMVDADDQPILLDFGLARHSAPGNATLTRTGTVLGTPAYMAPEQLGDGSTQLTPACDQYGLGVTLFQLLTGELPFTGPIHAVIAQVLFAKPPMPTKLRPTLDRELEAICLRAMAKQPAERYANARAFAQALHAWQDARATQAKSIPTLPLPPRPPRPTRRRALVAMSLYALGATGAAAWFWWKRPPTMPAPAPAEEMPRMPKTPPPVFDVLSLDMKRELTIVTQVAEIVPFTYVVEEAGEKREMQGTRVVWRTVEQKIPVTDLIVTDTDGKRYSAERTNKLFDQPTAVVLSSNGEDVDPFYLQPVVSGTPIVKLSAAHQQPRSAGWPAGTIHPIQGLARIDGNGDFEIRVPAFFYRAAKRDEPVPELKVPNAPVPGKGPAIDEEQEIALRQEPEPAPPPVGAVPPPVVAPARLMASTEISILAPEFILVFDARGKPVEMSVAVDRLKKPTAILLSADDRAVDPFFLRCLKDDTLVLIPQDTNRLLLPSAPFPAPPPVIPEKIDPPKKGA